ncbi:15776_t:CDS:2, partial [Funneliformis geosporum]
MSIILYADVTLYDHLNVEGRSLQDIENETIQIKVIEFAYLNINHKVIIYITSDYFRQVAFSDICIEMDESEQNDYLTDN